MNKKDYIYIGVILVLVVVSFIFLEGIVNNADVIAEKHYNLGWEDGRDAKCQGLTDFIMNDTLNNCMAWFCQEGDYDCDDELTQLAHKDTCIQIMTYGWEERK